MGRIGRIRAVRAADVSNKGTARSAAWRLPEAGIVKGLASPLTRTPAAERLKLPDGWRAEPAQSLCSANKKTLSNIKEILLIINRKDHKRLYRRE